MENNVFDIGKYAAKAREVVAEGIVMLENRNQVLPLADAAKVALFGRIQFNYYKSGTGSGGMVNTKYVTGILEALEWSSRFVLNQNVKAAYETWMQTHPFEEGIGWANEPWFQEEMPLSDELVAAAAKESEVAIVIIGRTAGEDQDNKAEAGSYLLTDLEHDMLKKVCSAFTKTVVLLNVGNIIDMKWVAKYRPASVLYVWQGGQEGGNGVLDVLSGTVSPSGKLPDTIAYDIGDYPSNDDFGDEVCNHYTEDIYVGYRYFETFARDKVLYPFGYGLSYTSFRMEAKKLEVTDGTDGREGAVVCTVAVTNTGQYSGKEVVQLYCQAPQGKLGKPLRSLCGFAKTGCLAPGQCEEVVISCPKYYLASYDDSGATGYRSSYVLEPGGYRFYVGSDVRTAAAAGSFQLPGLVVLETLKEAAAPVVRFKRMKPSAAIEGRYEIFWETAPRRTIDPAERRNEKLPADLPFTGDKGIKLADVANGNAAMEEFIAQLSDEELCCIVRGEGMCSDQVTPGTAGAFGGVTKSLQGYGIPAACCADGPSGIRMDSGTIAFAMPNGVCLASSFNEKLMVELYEFTGLELRKNQIDTILGPGMNIHRHPLNGRNFEYFSEDPLLTGKIAAAQLQGMHKYGVSGTIKHFACNNQEYKRTEVETVISERALREIYLRGYEIAVKDAGAYYIMTTYGPVNGLWTASNYDLLNTILRDEWGFDGIVMTDWWAKGNDEGQPGKLENTAAMIRAQNDLAMVTRNALENSNHDNSLEALQDGRVTRGEFQRSAANICRTVTKTPAFFRIQGITTELDEQLEKYIAKEEKQAAASSISIAMTDGLGIIKPEEINTAKGMTNLYQILMNEPGNYKIRITCKISDEVSTANEVAQLPMSVFWNRKLLQTITITGKDTKWQTFELMAGYEKTNSRYLKLFFTLGGIEISQLEVVVESEV